MGPKPPRVPDTKSAPEEALGKALDGALLRRIFSYVWPYKAGLALAIALLPVAAAIELAQPYLLKTAIDEHIAVGRLAGLDRLGVLYLLALIGQTGATFAQIWLSGQFHGVIIATTPSGSWTTRDLPTCSEKLNSLSAASVPMK